MLKINVQSSYYIPAEMTENLLTIDVLRQNIRTIAFYTMYVVAIECELDAPESGEIFW